MDMSAFTVSVMDSDVVSMLVSTGSVDRTSLGIDSVENNAAKVTSTTLVDVAVSVVVNGSVVSGTFASDDGVFFIVLTGTVVPGNSEVGAGVVSSLFVSGFVGVCTVVAVSGLSVLLSAPNLEASELSVD